MSESNQVWILSLVSVVAIVGIVGALMFSGGAVAPMGGNLAGMGYAATSSSCVSTSSTTKECTSWLSDGSMQVCYYKQVTNAKGKKSWQKQSCDVFYPATVTGTDAINPTTTTPPQTVQPTTTSPAPEQNLSSTSTQEATLSTTQRDSTTTSSLSPTTTVDQSLSPSTTTSSTTTSTPVTTTSTSTTSFASCTDSDGGFNPTVAGSISGSDAAGAPFKRLDNCWQDSRGGWNLDEYTCSGSAPAKSPTYCNNGCVSTYSIVTGEPLGGQCLP